MFKILNGREHFFQWDSNQKLVIDDRTIKEVHYCNRTDDCSLPVECYELDGLWIAEVPNELLQQAYPLRVWAVCGDYTKIEERFKVKAKTKPTDYVYTPTEVKRYDDLEQKIEEALSDEAISEAVSEYLVENPPQAVDLTPYATKEYVGEAIEAIDIPEVNLEPYALKTELPNLEPYALKTDIPDEPDLSPYALKKDIPDTSKFALKTEIPKEPDLTNYATKNDVAEAVGAIEVPEVDLEPYALKTDIPDTSEFALKSDVEAIETLKEYTIQNALDLTNDLPVLTEIYNNVKTKNTMGYNLYYPKDDMLYLITSWKFRTNSGLDMLELNFHTNNNATQFLRLTFYNSTGEYISAGLIKNDTGFDIADYATKDYVTTEINSALGVIENGTY